MKHKPDIRAAVRIALELIESDDSEVKESGYVLLHAMIGTRDAAKGTAYLKG